MRSIIDYKKLVVRGSGEKINHCEFSLVYIFIYSNFNLHSIIEGHILLEFNIFCQKWLKRMLYLSFVILEGENGNACLMYLKNEVQVD